MSGRLGAVLISLTAVLALAWAAGGSASTAEPQPPQGEPAASTPAERLEMPPGWLSSDTLLGLPSWVNLGINWTAQPFVNPVGGERQLSNGMQQGTLSLALGSGLGKAPDQWREIDRWSLALSVNHYGGNPNYANAIGALYALQAIAYPSGFLPGELSLNRSGAGDWLNLKAGMVPMNPSFISAPIFNSYVHSAFNNTLNLGLVNLQSQSNVSLPISPYAAWGGIASLQPRADLALSYGWFDLASTPSIASLLGGPALPRLSASGSAQILQLTWSPAAFGPAAGSSIAACRGRAGVQRRRGPCRHPLEVASQLPGGLLSLGALGSNSEGRASFASLTARSGLPIGLDERLWLGGSWATNADQSLGPRFIGGGWLIQGLLPKRPLDLLLLGVGQGSGLGNGPEAMVELGYQWQVNRNLCLQPTLQWILHPALDWPTPAGILAGGLQINVAF